MTNLMAILTVGSDKMAGLDPHGFTLSLECVSVVFAGLLTLFFIYYLSGVIFSGKFKRKPKAVQAEVPADAEVEAAIAMALHLYLTECTHDSEPNVLTFKAEPSAWADKSFTFRKTAR